MLPHFVFHSEMSTLEGSKYKARRLEDPNIRLKVSRIEIQGSKARGLRARGSKYKARGLETRHIEYSQKRIRCPKTCGVIISANVPEPNRLVSLFLIGKTIEYLICCLMLVTLLFNF